MLKSALLLSIALVVLPEAYAERDNWNVPSTMQFSLTPESGGQHAQLWLSFSQSHGGHSQSSDSFAWGDFDGLTRADIMNAPAHAVRFRIAREAGVFTCSGVGGANTASGTCHFSGDANFVAAFRQRGFAAPTQGELYYLALSNFHMTLLDELDRQHYTRPSVDEIVEASVLDVDTDFVRGMSAQGYRLGSLDDLEQLRVQNVTPEYIRDLATLGPAFTHLSADDLTSLGIAGVTPQYVREMSALGYADQPPSQYGEMRLQSVDAAYVRELNALGYRNIPADQLVEASIFGVDGDFIRGMRSAGYAQLSLEELIDLRIHDVTRGYASRINAARRQHRSAR